MKTLILRKPSGLQHRLKLMRWYLACFLNCFAPKAVYAKGFFLGAAACSWSAESGDTVVVADVVVFNRSARKAEKPELPGQKDQPLPPEPPEPPKPRIL